VHDDSEEPREERRPARHLGAGCISDEKINRYVGFGRAIGG
jgi:hypothetical protein